jgi:hypothetical protein
MELVASTGANDLKVIQECHNSKSKNRLPHITSPRVLIFLSLPSISGKNLLRTIAASLGSPISVYDNEG